MDRGEIGGAIGSGIGTGGLYEDGLAAGQSTVEEALLIGNQDFPPVRLNDDSLVGYEFWAAADIHMCWSWWARPSAVGFDIDPGIARAEVFEQCLVGL